MCLQWDGHYLTFPWNQEFKYHQNYNWGPWATQCCCYKETKLYFRSFLGIFNLYLAIFTLHSIIPFHPSLLILWLIHSSLLTPIRPLICRWWTPMPDPPGAVRWSPNHTRGGSAHNTPPQCWTPSQPAKGIGMLTFTIFFVVSGADQLIFGRH